MKKSIKLFALLAGVILFASACAQRTCPTYTVAPVEADTQIEATV